MSIAVCPRISSVATAGRGQWYRGEADPSRRARYDARAAWTARVSREFASRGIAHVFLKGRYLYVPRQFCARLAEVLGLECAVSIK